MTVKDLEALYDYYYWANGKLVDVVATLTPDEFTRKVAGSYESVRNTMVHILSAEWGWLDRCGGPKRGPKLNSADYPDLATLRAKWTAIELEMRRFLASLTDADLARSVEFSFPDVPARSLPVGELLHHAAVHGVHHRGQVALLLRELGHAPGNFDILMYYAAKAGT